MYGVTACTKKVVHSNICHQSFGVGKKESEAHSEHGSSTELAHLPLVAAKCFKQSVMYVKKAGSVCVA